MRLAVPKAFVALAPGHAGRTATRRCRSSATCAAHLAPFKRVRRLEFAELPKTISGKIRRVELRGAERQNRAERPDAARASSGKRTFPSCAADAGGGDCRGLCFYPVAAPRREPRLFPAEIIATAAMLAWRDYPAENIASIAI